MTHKLKQNGVLNDIGSMQTLFNVVKNDIVIDNGWSVLDFASQASNLTGGNAQFITLPTTGTTKVDGEDALTVDPAAIKAAITATFTNDAAVAPPPTTASSSAASSTPPPAAPSTTPTPPANITVENGTSTTGLALKVSGVLFDDGIPVSKTGNGGNGVSHTTIRYGAGAADLAAKIQGKLGTSRAPIPSSSLPKNAIVITIGSDYHLPPATTKPPSGQPTSSATGAPTGGSSDSSGLSSGGAVTMSGSQDGIPCVY